MLYCRSGVSRCSSSSRASSPWSLPPSTPRGGSPCSHKTWYNSSSSLLSCSTLPSVHRNSALKSFVNPNCTSVVHASRQQGNNSRKLASASFTFSPSKCGSRSAQAQPSVVQAQPTAKPTIRGSSFRGGAEEQSSDGAGSKSLKTVKGEIRKSPPSLRDISAAAVPGSNVQQSIICSKCGRCRCLACCTPRAPPSTWLCAGKCLCSPASLVDCLSCACCVKACLYHCGGDETSRWRWWACLALGALPLPCLLCYVPLTALRRLMETGYQRCTSQGCRCPSTDPRLLH